MFKDEHGLVQHKADIHKEGKRAAAKKGIRYTLMTLMENMSSASSPLELSNTITKRTAPKHKKARHGANRAGRL